MKNDTRMSQSATMAGLWLFATIAALLSLAACDSGGPTARLGPIDALWVAVLGTVRRPWRVQALPEAG